MRERSSTRLVWAQAAVLSIGLLACASDALDPAPGKGQQELGDATRQIRERQIQNPERSETLTPVEGIGATTAAEVSANYHTNQKTAAQQQRQERQRDNGLSDQ